MAGIITDEAIERTKGAPTVLKMQERVELARACRWVDEVIPDLPYALPLSLLDELRCEYTVHGDDLPKTFDGMGLLDEANAAGRLLIVKRTEGTSTTMLIGRRALAAPVVPRTPPPRPASIWAARKFAFTRSARSARFPGLVPALFCFSTSPWLHSLPFGCISWGLLRACLKDGGRPEVRGGARGAWARVSGALSPAFAACGRREGRSRSSASFGVAPWTSALLPGSARPPSAPILGTASCCSVAALLRASPKPPRWLCKR